MFKSKYPLNVKLKKGKKSKTVSGGQGKNTELPSFLLGLNYVPKNTGLLQKYSPNYEYPRPLFFGNYEESQRSDHVPKVNRFRPIQQTQKSNESLLKNIYFPKEEVEKPVVRVPSFHPVIRRKRVYADPYPHKCPGFKKIYRAHYVPHCIDFGKTTSIIEGEMLQEVPFYHVKNVMSSTTIPSEFKIVMLSDIREKNIKCMSYKDRIAHPHFPKEIITVRVIGPTIPAPITITQLPSKRKRETEFEDIIIRKRRTGKCIEEVEVKTEELQMPEVRLTLKTEDEVEKAERLDDRRKAKPAQKIKEENAETVIQEEVENEELEMEGVEEKEEENDEEASAYSFLSNPVIL